MVKLYSKSARKVSKKQKKNISAMLEGLESRLLMAANSISVVAGDVAGDEAGNTMTVTIARTGDTTNPLTVFYKLSGTATANADYSVAGGGLTSAVILAGQTDVEITFTPKQDTKGEQDETVILTLVAKPTYDLDANVNNRKATAAIADDEPRVSIEAIDDEADEGGDTGKFRITRTGDTTNPLTVFYQRTGTAKVNTDFTANGSAASIVIPGGQASVDITITPVQNQLAEVNETVIYKLLAKPAYSVDAGAATDTVTITDDEPTLTVEAQDAAAVETQVGDTVDGGVFHITRDGSTDGAIVLKFTMSGEAKRGTDYVLRTGSVAGPIFTTTLLLMADGESTLDIFVTPVDDALTEVPEGVTLTIGKSTAYNLPVDPLDAKDTVTITDNEPVVSVVKTKNASETNPTTTGKGVFTFSRTGDKTSALTVNYTVTGTATESDDYIALSGTVEIPAGKSSVTVDVTAVTDEDIEGDTVIVTINTSGNYTPSVASGAATMSIGDTPISGAALFGNITFTETTNNPAGPLVSTGGTFVSSNGRSGGYFYSSVNIGPQIRIATLDLFFDADPSTLTVNPATLTFTISRPQSIANRTINFMDAKAGSSGDFDASGTLFNGAEIDVLGFFKLI